VGRGDGITGAAGGFLPPSISRGYDVIPGANHYGLPKYERRELEAHHPERLCERCGGYGERRIFNPEQIVACPPCRGTGLKL
jgi:hypothetical protein